MVQPLQARDVAFVLFDLLEAERLCALEAFREHGRESFEAALATAERLALVGDAEGAVRMARRAMDLLPSGSPGWRRADDIAALAPGPGR